MSRIAYEDFVSVAAGRHEFIASLKCRQIRLADDQKFFFKAQTLCQYGGDFNILLSTFKLALLVSFVAKYYFESLTRERGQQG